MYNSNKFLKCLSVILVFCLIFTLANFPIKYAAAQEMSSEEEKALIEERIKELNNKLNALDKKSADTEEYLSILNEKIGYLAKQLDGVTDEVKAAKDKVNSLKDKYEQNEKEIASSKIEIKELTKKLDDEKAVFDESYDLYCKRLYVMYVSGETSHLSFLIESKDISQLLTRYEMIRRVSQRDSDLLKQVRAEMEEVNSSKNELTKKADSLAAKQAELEKTTKAMESSILDLQEKQISLDKKRTSLSEERAKTNVLLKKLGEEKGIYTEFLEEDKKTLDDIDREIAEAEKQYATTTTATTTKHFFN